VQFKSDNNNIVHNCQYHVVFCPKYRRPVLVDSVDERLKEIIAEVAAEMPFEIDSLSVMSDHVHLLLTCEPQFSIHQIVKRIKSRSSSYLRQEFPWLKSRLPTLWSNSYFVATVGGAPLDVIKRYIEEQKWKTGG
jgi:putative transposase